MIVYQTVDGVFAQAIVLDVGDIDPMAPGEYLIPAGCVTEAPPELAEGQWARWEDDAWVVEAIPVPPGPTADDLWVKLRAQRDARIDAVSWRYERHARELRLGIAPTDDLALLDAYIQALADLPENITDPAAPDWPAIPA